jgi:predicted transcriptional regulator of viral defense system
MRKSFNLAKNILEENQGILRTSQAKKLGIDPKTIYEMVDVGILVKESRGVFRLANLPPLSNPDFILVALRVPQSVICLISALAFHNLTSQLPYKVFIAIPQGVKRPRINYPPIEVIKPIKEIYHAGINNHSIDGVDVRIYNKEKTISDCFKYRNKIGLDIAIEALKDYLRQPDSDLEKLFTYAKINHVEKRIRNYLEAIL